MFRPLIDLIRARAQAANEPPGERAARVRNRVRELLA